MLEIAVLGGLQVVDGDRPVTVHGRRQQALLGLLALHRGTPVEVQRIAVALWADEQPRLPRRAVEVYAGRLRRDLGAAAAAVLTRSPGYLLDPAATRLDLDDFRALLARSEVALAADDLWLADELARKALRLWTGPPLSGVLPSVGDWPECAALVDLRPAALSIWVTAGLGLGRAEALLPDLHRLVAGDPLHEGLRAKLMQALLATGRRGDALRVYAEGRRLLVDRLGLEPGPELRQRHREALAGTEPKPLTSTVAGPGSRIGEALRRAGEFAAGVGGHQQALRCWQAALEIVDEDRPAERAGVLLRMAEAQYHLTEGGREAALEARRLFDGHGDLDGVMESEACLARSEWAAGHFERAVRHADRAVQVARAAPTSLATVSVLGTCAGILAVSGRRAAAERLADEVVEAAERLRSDRALAYALSYRGVVRIQRADPGAIADLERGCATYERDRGWAPAAVVFNLAEAYAVLGQLDRARALAPSAVRSAELAGAPADARWNALQRLYLTWWDGRTADADRMATDLAGGGTDEVAVLAQLVRAKLRSALGQDGQAEDLAVHTLGRAREIGDPQIVVPALALRARLAAAAGRPEDASALASEALAALAGRFFDPIIGADLACCLHLLKDGPDALGALPRTPWVDATASVLRGDLDDAVRRFRAIGSVPDAEAAALLRPRGR